MRPHALFSLNDKVCCRLMQIENADLLAQDHALGGHDQRVASARLLAALGETQIDVINVPAIHLYRASRPTAGASSQERSSAVSAAFGSHSAINWARL